MDNQITKHIAVVVSEDEMSADLFLGVVDDPDSYYLTSAYIIQNA